jgi:UDP-N-acetylmuramate dehydrogenase
MTPLGRSLDPAAVAAEIQRRIGVRVLRDEPLARHTTMRVGGPADLLCVARTAFELRALIRFARGRELPHLVLGRGSDVVVADRGVRGLVIVVRAEGARLEQDGRYVAEAGLPMARAATETTQAGLAGLEFGLAIPGTVGGAVWANAGAHDGEVAAVLESARLLRADGDEVLVGGAELGFAYRESRLKVPVAEDGTLPLVPADVVLTASFRLTPAPAEELRRRLDEIRRWRRAHQPLGLPSAGSVFRNPSGGPPAGKLIDEAGLKGARLGGATVSPVHANFIVNDGGGRAADVRSLAEFVRRTVARRFGIELAYEVVFVGDWSDWRPADGVVLPDGAAPLPAEADREGTR